MWYASKIFIFLVLVSALSRMLQVNLWVGFSMICMAGLELPLSDLCSVHLILDFLSFTNILTLT